MLLSRCANTVQGSWHVGYSPLYAAAHLHTGNFTLGSSPRDVEKDPGFTSSPGCTTITGVSWYLLRRGACVVAAAEVTGAAEASANAGASEHVQQRPMEKRHAMARMPATSLHSRMSKPVHSRTFISKQHIRSTPWMLEYGHHLHTKHEARHIALSPANQLPTLIRDLACETASLTCAAHAWRVPATNQRLTPFLDQS